MRTRLKGLLNQICWLGGCLLITYVPWGPSDMVNTPDYSHPGQNPDTGIEIVIMSACLPRRVKRKGYGPFDKYSRCTRIPTRWRPPGCTLLPGLLIGRGGSPWCGWNVSRIPSLRGLCFDRSMYHRQTRKRKTGLAV